MLGNDLDIRDDHIRLFIQVLLAEVENHIHQKHAFDHLVKDQELEVFSDLEGRKVRISEDVVAGNEQHYDVKHDLPSAVSADDQLVEAVVLVLALHPCVEVVVVVHRLYGDLVDYFSLLHDRASEALGRPVSATLDEELDLWLDQVLAKELTLFEVDSPFIFRFLHVDLIINKVNRLELDLRVLCGTGLHVILVFSLVVHQHLKLQSLAVR